MLLFAGKTARQIGFEFGFEQRHAIFAAAAVPNRIFNRDIGGFAAVLEKDLHGVGDRALGRIKVILAPLAIFNAHHFVTQGVDARIRGDTVLVVSSGQVTFKQADGSHVLDAMVAVGGVAQRALLVDDANCGFMCGNDDILDLVDAVPDLIVQIDRTFYRGLRMEFSREGNLEQHILHHIGAVFALEGKGFALEQHVVKAPGLGAQCRGISHLALQGHQGETHGAAGGVAGGP